MSSRNVAPRRASALDGWVQSVEQLWLTMLMNKLIYFFLLCLFTSCSSEEASQQQKELKELQKKVEGLDKNYDLALAHGRESVPVVKEFNRLFTQASNWISYYTGEYGNPEWNSKVGLHDRYILTMQFKIEFDDTRTRIINFEEPRFDLVEVETISYQPDGTYKITYGTQQVRFDITEWKRLVESNGDFSGIGAALEKDKPVPKFSGVLGTL